jgi:hypothetical protein
MTFSGNEAITCFSPNWTYQCSTGAHLNSMMTPKSCAPSNNHQTLPSKSWKISYVLSPRQTYTSTTLNCFTALVGGTLRQPFKSLNHFIRQCEWAVKETDWLGYWLTPSGIKPWKKKVNSILAIRPPSTIAGLQSFAGSVNFYRNMFRPRSHPLAPLTSQPGNRTLKWRAECQSAFGQVKALLAQEILLQY